MSHDDRDLGPDVPAQSVDIPATRVSHSPASGPEVTMAAKIGAQLDRLNNELQELRSELKSASDRGLRVMDILFGGTLEPEGAAGSAGQAQSRRQLGLEAWLTTSVEDLILLVQQTRQEMCAHYDRLSDVAVRLGSPSEDGDPDNG